MKNLDGTKSPGESISTAPTGVDFSGIILDFDMVNSPTLESTCLAEKRGSDTVGLSVLEAPILVDVSRYNTQIGEVSMVDMRTLLRKENYAGNDGNFTITKYIDSYSLFENVRRLIFLALEKAKKEGTFDESLQKSERVLSENIIDITRLKVNLWIFDRLANGSGEFITKSPAGVVAKNGDKIHFPIWDSNIIPDYINLQGEIFESDQYTSWSPIIALYGKAKSILLLNESYYQAMGTNPDEFSTLIEKGRMKDLFALFDEKQFEKLTLFLSQGLGYKNEVLHTRRTKRSIAWNSFGNEESGSIRIGKDITNGVHPLIPKTEFEGVSLNTEQNMQVFSESIEPVIQKMSDITARVMRTWLRALYSCAYAVDMFWDHGPYFMNIIADGKVIGNKNYADLIGKTANNVPLTEFYSPEVQAFIEESFIEGYKVGHYERIFPVTSSDGITRDIAWHRYFPKDIPGLPKGITVGFGTDAIIGHHKGGKIVK